MHLSIRRRPTGYANTRPTVSLRTYGPALRVAHCISVNHESSEITPEDVYVNRRAGATTGAWPGTQTFCGWKSSGSTGKGGLGPYYLTQFMREQSRTVVGGTTQ